MLGNIRFTGNVNISSLVKIITNIYVNIGSCVGSRPVHHKAAKASAYSSNFRIINYVSFCTKFNFISFKNVIITNIQTADCFALCLHAGCANSSAKRSINSNAANLINRIIDGIDINLATSLIRSKCLTSANIYLSLAAIFNLSIKA